MIFMVMIFLHFLNTIAYVCTWQGKQLPAIVSFLYSVNLMENYKYRKRAFMQIMPPTQQTAGLPRRRLIKYGKYNSEYRQAPYFAAVHWIPGTPL